MRAIEIARANAILYFFVLCLFCLVAAYQLRISLDSVHAATNLDFYIPFLLDPFTNRIDASDSTPSWEQGSQYDSTRHSVIHWRDELLSVNGQAFRGMALYLQELWKSEIRPPPQSPNYEAHPLLVTIRTRDFQIHHVEFASVHCSCGTPTVLGAAATLMVPPMFCVLLGFLAVCFRPKEMLAWAFLGLMLSLSQFQALPEWYTGFQHTATTMMWTNQSCRVLGVGYRSFVQHSWPAGLLLASAHFYRSRKCAYRLALCVAALFLLLAALAATLQVGWSEDFRRFVNLYGILQHYWSELMTASLVGIAGVAWLLNRALGAIVMAFTLLMILALYWLPPSIPDGNWIPSHSDASRIVTWNPFTRDTHGLVAPLFAAGCLLSAVKMLNGDVTRLEVGSLILCLPFAVGVVSLLCGFWYPFGPQLFAYRTWCVLASAGIGSAGLGWSVLRRTTTQ